MNTILRSKELTSLFSPILSDPSLAAIDRFQICTQLSDLKLDEQNLLEVIKTAISRARTVLESSNIDDYTLRLKMTELYARARCYQS